jgi:cytochrome P450
VIDYEPTAPETDPAVYRELRERCPVHRFDDAGRSIFTLSRYDDVQAMFRSASAWSSRYGQDVWYKDEPGFRNDPPEHTLYRRVLNRTLSAQVVDQHATAVRTTVAARIDALPPTGGDLLDDVTGVLPRDLFAPVLGIPEADGPALWGWTFDVLAAAEAADPTRIITWEEQKARAPWLAAHEYLSPLVAERRAAGPRAGARPPAAPDLLTAMAEARDDAGAALPDDAITQAIMLVYFGAVHTTATLLTNALLRLLDRRELWDRLCADPALAATVVEESARFDSPVAGIFRTASATRTVHDVEIPEDAKVRGLFAAANRDPAVFDDPDTFRLDRELGPLGRQQLGFGFGVHLCAGAPFARLEGRIILQELARRKPGLRVPDSSRWWAERVAIDLRRPAGLLPSTW